MLLGYTPKLGDIVRLTPAIHYDKNGVSDEKEYPGKIIYINRKHRYFTVEFVFPFGGSFRESFKYAEEGDLACRISC